MQMDHMLVWAQCSLHWTVSKRPAAFTSALSASKQCFLPAAKPATQHNTALDSLSVSLNFHYNTFIWVAEFTKVQKHITVKFTTPDCEKCMSSSKNNFLTQETLHSHNCRGKQGNREITREKQGNVIIVKVSQVATWE